MPFNLGGFSTSLSVRRYLELATNALTHSYQRIASGSRVVRASEDPSGVAIAGSLESNLKSMGQARRNAGAAATLGNVAQGNLNEIGNLLTRMRELAIQASSDTVNDDERGLLQLEAEQLNQEITHIADTTKYGEQVILNGAGHEMTFQIGIDNSESSRITFDPGAMDARSEALGVDGLDLSSSDSALDALDTVDQAFVKLNPMRARFAAFQSRLDSIQNTTSIQEEGMSEALHGIRDTDYAQESATIAESQIRQQMALSMLTQANALPHAVLKLLGD